VHESNRILASLTRVISS